MRRRANGLRRPLTLWLKKTQMSVMSKTMILRARVEPRRKAAAERILRRYGVTLPQFINMSLAQVELRHGLPFRLDEPENLAPAREATAKYWNELYDDDYSR